MAEEFHRFRKFRTFIDPKTPTQGEPVDTIEMTFKLESSDGIDPARFRLLINDVQQSLNGATINISNRETDVSAGTETADVVFKTFNNILTRVNNVVTLQYLISPSILNNPRVEREFDIRANAATNFDANGNVTVIPIINIEVEDEFQTNEVSIEPRKILVTARHDKRLIDSITAENFNSITNPITKNMRVIQFIDGNRQNITGLVTYEVVEESIEIDENILQTTFQTNNLDIIDIQRLRFRVNLDNFYNDSGLNFTEDVITRDREDLIFNAQTIDLENVSIDSDLNFSLVNTRGGVSTYRTDTVNINTNYFITNNGNPITQFDGVRHFIRERGQKLKASATALKKNKVNVKSEDPVFVDGNAVLFVPSVFTIKQRSKNLSRKGFFSSDVPKTMYLPMRIFAKDSNNIDVILQHELEIPVNMIFPETTSGSGEESE